MATSWSKNESDPNLRTVLMQIYMSDGVTFAPRSTDFTGCVFLKKQSGSIIKGTGAIENLRRPLTVDDDEVESVDTTDSTLKLTAHGLETGDGPFQLTTTSALPAGLSALTDYWIIAIDDDNISLAENGPSDAYLGLKVTISDAGDGDHTLEDTDATERGMDREFLYKASQGDTDTDTCEFGVFVEKENFTRALSTVNVRDSSFAGFDDTCEGSVSYGDAFRVLFAAICGKASGFNTGTIKFRDPATGTKIRLTLTTDATGRLTSVIGDVTP